MNPFLATVVLLAGLTQTPTSVDTSSAYKPAVAVRTDLAVSQASPQNQLFGSLVSDTTALEHAQQPVLVLPTPDLSPESLADLTEDMTVMCRIFDKSVLPARANISFAYGDRSDATVAHYLYTMDQQSRGTQGLYLDGYGAVFFLDVDYPLVPTGPQESAPAKAADSADSVWAQTVKEMNGQQDNQPQAGRSAPAYDALRVENLKKAVIRTLTHASNIRMRRPQDVITLVVGDLDSGKTARYGGDAYSRSRGRRGPVLSGGGGPLTAAANPGAALLIMRATKADVDAFAKGQLTLTQFTDKVQTISLPIEQGAPSAGAAPAAGVRAR